MLGQKRGTDDVGRCRCRRLEVWLAFVKDLQVTSMFHCDFFFFSGGGVAGGEVIHSHWNFGQRGPFRPPGMARVAVHRRGSALGGLGGLLRRVEGGLRWRCCAGGGLVGILELCEGGGARGLGLGDLDRPRPGRSLRGRGSGSRCCRRSISLQGNDGRAWYWMATGSCGAGGGTVFGCGGSAGRRRFTALGGGGGGERWRGRNGSTGVPSGFRSVTVNDLPLCKVISMAVASPAREDQR